LVASTPSALLTNFALGTLVQRRRDEIKVCCHPERL
jgi:hypothetical protein